MFVGWDTLILSSLVSGAAAGVMTGTANVIPAGSSPSTTESRSAISPVPREAWARIRPRLDAALSTSYIAAVKASLRREGIGGTGPPAAAAAPPAAAARMGPPCGPSRSVPDRSRMPCELRRRNVRLKREPWQVGRAGPAARQKMTRVRLSSFRKVGGLWYHTTSKGPEMNGTYPVHVDGTLDPQLSRWMWLVKWILVIPHYVLLFFLWIAFIVTSIVAFFAILITGRYPGRSSTSTSGCCGGRGGCRSTRTAPSAPTDTRRSR